MERHFGFHIYQKLVILLILFLRIASWVDGFSSSSEVSDQVGNCGKKSNSINSNISPLCASRRYIMQSYFEKHQDLLDSDFQDFIVHELPSGFCEVLPDNLSLAARLSILNRSLVGEGSHRHLSSSIGFHIQPEFVTEVPAHFCEVIIIERLPSGVFADPFELQHLHQRSVFTDAAVFGDTNLELPSFLSNHSVVEIHMDVGPNIFLRNGNELEFNIQLPLHARYPRLEESGYSRVKFGDPDLFMSCRVEGKQENHSCVVLSTIGSAEPETAAVVWKIPAGIQAHAEVVSTITFLSAFLSTLLIIVTSICSSNNEQSEIFKIS